MKKEKILIVLITIIILLGVFIAFVVSNSQKTPPDVLVQNEDGKTSEAVMGGYTWKVFGSNIIADAVDLKTLDYTSDNTIVVKTNEVLTLSTTEKFRVEEINFYETVSEEIIKANVKTSDVTSYCTVTVPELEGTYLCLFKLEYSGKGSAEYAVRVVVTDENIYDVKEIITYQNTKATTITTIKEILNKLPYADDLNGITINAVDMPKSMNIRYNNISVKKDDLLNNTIAIFTLIPDIDFISYKTNNVEKDIIYTRDEVNNIMGRNILEYAEDAELWLKEVIYKEPNTKLNNIVTMYASVISSSLANHAEKEIGEFVAIDLNGNNFSGDILLNEYDKKELLDKLNNEYENVLIVNGNEIESDDGTILYVALSEKQDENIYVMNVRLEKNKSYNYSYKVVFSDKVVSVEPNIESGEQE